MCRVGKQLQLGVHAVYVPRHGREAELVIARCAGSKICFLTAVSRGVEN
jgi:hypothetical protein